MKVYPVHTPAARLQLALAERLWAGGDQLAATGAYLEAVFAAEVAVSAAAQWVATRGTGVRNAKG